MIGLVLCGGQSSRMGADKGLLPLDKGNWALAAAEKISILEFPVFFSVSTTQYETYSGIFDVRSLITDDDTLMLKGPLCGVLSAHLRFPEEDLLVLACDMPLMNVSVLKQLTGIYQQDPVSKHAYVFSNGGEPEPLCAIYTSTSMTHIDQLRKNGGLKKHSMKYAIEHIEVFFIPVAEKQKEYFRNFNAHADINGG